MGGPNAVNITTRRGGFHGKQSRFSSSVAARFTCVGGWDADFTGTERNLRLQDKLQHGIVKCTNQSLKRIIHRDTAVHFTGSLLHVLSSTFVAILFAYFPGTVINIT